MQTLIQNWNFSKAKLLKIKVSFKALYPYKDARKVKDFRKLSNKENYSTLQSNSTKSYNKPFKSISWQIFLKDTLFLVKKDLMDRYFLSGIKLFIFCSLNPVIHRMGKAAKCLSPSPDVENKKSLNPILYFIASSPKLL